MNCPISRAWAVMHRWSSTSLPTSPRARWTGRAWAWPLAVRKKPRSRRPDAGGSARGPARPRPAHLPQRVRLQDRRRTASRCTTPRPPGASTWLASPSSGSSASAKAVCHGHRRHRAAQHCQGRVAVQRHRQLPAFMSTKWQSNCRSRMNIPFFLRDESRNEAFLAEPQSAGLLQLKGHKSVGGDARQPLQRHATGGRTGAGDLHARI